MIKKPSEYVRNIIRNHPSIVPKDETLEAIFNEIRNTQSSKKIIMLLKVLQSELLMKL